MYEVGQELSYDALLDQLIEMRKEEAERIWDQASIIYVLRTRMQVKAGDIASEMNCSSTYVNDLARAFGAFPEPSDRSLELTFTHHKIASKSEDPQYWLAEAEANQWSCKQLQEAIKGKPEDTALDKVQKLYEKIVKVLEDGGPEADWLADKISELGLSQ